MDNNLTVEMRLLEDKYIYNEENDIKDNTNEEGKDNDQESEEGEERKERKCKDNINGEEKCEWENDGMFAKYFINFSKEVIESDWRSYTSNQIDFLPLVCT